MITADDEEPVVARGPCDHRLGEGMRVVHLELLPGDPLDDADVLTS